MKLKYFLQWFIIPAKDKQTTLSKNARQTVYSNHIDNTVLSMGEKEI